MGKPSVDLTDSAHDFQQLVYPKLIERGFLVGRLELIEAATEERVAKLLDTLTGMDSWLIEDGKGIVGLASRVQWGTSTWDSFTVRKERLTGSQTEFAKRRIALKSDGKYLYPYYTCQAYISERRIGEILSLGIAKTKDIFEFIEKGLATENKSDNPFFVIAWGDFKTSNYEIQYWHSPNLEQTNNPMVWQLKERVPIIWQKRFI